MARKRPTVADLRARKGEGPGQLTMLRIFTLDEAAAAERAGIDIVSTTPELIAHPRFLQVAPSLFAMTGKTHLEAGPREDYLRFWGQMMQAGADAIYCSGGLGTLRYLADEYIRVVGHVGLVPSRATWTGGFRAVVKTADAAIGLYEQRIACKAAGAFAVEIEVVPVEVVTEISRRMKSLLLWSMGAGAGCDVQYLFSEDILEENRGHLPRHAKVYRNFAAEHDRLQAERMAAYREFIADVALGAYPEDRLVVRMDVAEHEHFLSCLPKV